LAALVATSPANVFYVSGYRGLSPAVDRATELFAVFTRRGTALVVPAIAAPAVAAELAPADQVVCYGAFTDEVGERRDENTRRGDALRGRGRQARRGAVSNAYHDGGAVGAPRCTVDARPPARGSRAARGRLRVQGLLFGRRPHRGDG